MFTKCFKEEYVWKFMLPLYSLYRDNFCMNPQPKHEQCQLPSKEGCCAEMNGAVAGSF